MSACRIQMRHESGALVIERRARLMSKDVLHGRSLMQVLADYQTNTQKNEPCRVYDRVRSRIWGSQHIRKWVTPYTQMSRGAQENGWCRTHERAMSLSHVVRLHEICRIWTREACHTLIPHWRTNESCRISYWVMSHISKSQKTYHTRSTPHKHTDLIMHLYMRAGEYWTLVIHSSLQNICHEKER